MAVYKFYKNHAKEIAGIHLHAPNIGWLHLPIATFFGIKRRIVHSHNTKYSDKKANVFRNFFLISCSRPFITDYFACGQDAAIFLFGKRNLNNTYIFHNAIDVSRYRFNPDMRIRKRNELELNDRLVFGHIGNFLPQKNHHYLIKLFKSIVARHPNSLLLLVGIGPLEKEITEKVELLDLSDNIRFLGYRSDVVELLMAIDVILFPSLFEGFPMSIVEAQCAGLPCFLSKTITREIKLTNNVFFLPLADENIWIDCIFQQLKEYQRTDHSNELKQAGYNLSDEVKLLETHYSNIFK